jgi:hypothetical protein
MSEKILILRNIQQKKAGGVSISDKPNEAVAIVSNIKTKKNKYVNNDPNSNEKNLIIESDNYIVEPYIPIRLQRLLWILSGDSGQGKSLLASLGTKQYLKHFPKNRIFFISQTSYRDDENLKSLPFKQLDIETLEDYQIEDFKDSLILFDDIDNSDSLKKAMKLLNRATELGRKFNVSVIFCTHIHSRLNMSTIYREAQMYTTFPDSLHGNRQLYNNMKIPQNLIDELKETQNGFITFNKTYRTIITDKFIWKY